jgi:hypothetical protein
MLQENGDKTELLRPSSKVIIKEQTHADYTGHEAAYLVFTLHDAHLDIIFGREPCQPLWTNQNTND